MFERPDNTYVISDESISAITNDISNPINQIQKILFDNAKILDIGAGNGSLARYLNSCNMNVTIDAVEPSALGSRLCSPYYRKIYAGFFEDFITEISLEKYDFIVLADVLEHVVRPDVLLSKLCEIVQDETKILISLPNISFGAVVLSLLNGNFNYRDSGLLERTHLRFFTFETACDLVEHANLYINEALHLQRSFFRTEISSSSFKGSPFVLIKLALNVKFRVYQYLFVVQKKRATRIDRYYGTGFFKIIIHLLLSNKFIKKLVCL